MKLSRIKPSGALAMLTVGLVLGLAAPAAAHQAHAVAKKISGSSIKAHSIPANRLEKASITGTQIRPGSVGGSGLKADSVTGAQINENTLGVVPQSTLAQTLPPLVWNDLSLEGGWTAFNATARPPAYAIDAQGLVHFRGALTCASNCDLAFYLPAEAIPDAPLDLPIYTDGGNFGDMSIPTTGAVVLIDGAGSSGDADSYSALNGVTYAPN